jgi:predicted nuclease of predicted toxin-antitoxin system
MRFLVDAQLPPALARLLREHGHAAEHVTDIGPGDASDRELWQYAVTHRAVIVTKDEDFSLILAARGWEPAVVWVRVGNTRKAALLAWFEPLIDQITALVEADQKLIELR